MESPLSAAAFEQSRVQISNPAPHRLIGNLQPPLGDGVAPKLPLAAAVGEGAASGEPSFAVMRPGWAAGRQWTPGGPWPTTDDGEYFTSTARIYLRERSPRFAHSRFLKDFQLT